MELEGRKELVDTGKSSRTWSVPTGGAVGGGWWGEPRGVVKHVGP